MPVMPTHTSAPVRSRTPSAIAAATGSLTAPCASISSAGTSADVRLELVAVEDRALRRRSRSCPRRRSAATSADRRCTIRPPRWSSDARAASHRPVPPCARPSVLKTSAPRAPTSAAEASRNRRSAAAGSDERSDRCSSIWPGVARIVVSIGSASDRHDRIERLSELFDVRLPAAGDEQAGPVDPIAGGARAERAFTERVQHRLQLARRSRQQHDDLLAVLDVLSRRRPVRVREHRAAPRAPAPDGGSCRASAGRAARTAPRCARPVPAARSRAARRRRRSHRGSGRRRSDRGRRSPRPGRPAPAPAAQVGDRSRSSPTTAFARSSMPMAGQPFRDVERVGVEAGGSEQLGADGDDFDRAQSCVVVKSQIPSVRNPQPLPTANLPKLTPNSQYSQPPEFQQPWDLAFGSGWSLELGIWDLTRLMTTPPTRAADSTMTRSAMFAYIAAIASSAITPRPPCSLSNRRAGNGLITSKIRNSTKPISAPVRLTGMNASVISMPDDFVHHDRPGIDAAEIALRCRPGPDAGAQTAAG